ncbi:hypothetical protein CSB09_01130 [Candidatus Gracilibacteria bacterium]|nr:MAG: hypothetical protein CSB09_01130 [Candidatus Gracilibacteria bacterium]
MVFQATCSKGSSKLTLSVTADSIEQAKYILHSQGYSIIEIHETENTSQKNGNFFYFDAYVGGILQTGKIQSNDIFKSYRKLVENLKYDVKYIYTNPNMSEDQKIKMTAKVRDGYNLYRESLEKNNEEIQETEKKVTTDEDISDEFSSEVLKELERYETVVNNTIEKIQNLLIKYDSTINIEQKSTLSQIELELTKIRGTRNISKMKNILENSLNTIGSVELYLLKQGMVKEKKKFLSQTNDLLKEIGSDNKIQTEDEKQKDIGYKLKSFFQKIVEKKEETPEEEIQTIDTNSFVYLKNKRELSIYKKRLSKNTRDIIQKILSFKFSDLKRLYLKRKLLKQNIQIVQNRIHQKHVSYTKIVHGFGYYKDKFFAFIHGISMLITVIIFIYTVVYIYLSSFDSLGIIKISFLEKSLFFVVFFTLLNFLLSLVRGWKTLIFVVILFFPIISFLNSNF